MTATPPPPHARQPSAAMPPDAERTWGLVAPLSSLAAAFFLLAFIGPLVVWLLKRDQSRFVADQAVESLNFDLSMYLYGAIAGVLGFVLGVLTLGLALLPFGLLFGAGGLWWFVLSIVGAVKASNGEAFRYPLTIRFVRP